MKGTTMIGKIRAALGVAAIGILAIVAMNVMGASAVTPGVGNHFTSSTTNTKYTVSEKAGTAHTIHWMAYGVAAACDNPQYSVHHTTTATFQALTVTPVEGTNWNCTTSSNETFIIHSNGCHYQFTSKATAATHATVHLLCPVGKTTEVTLGASLLTFKPQTPNGGATYTNTNGEITVNVTMLGMHVQCDGGPCILAGGTRMDGKMEGAMTIAGFDTTTGAKSHITAT
jgi:hypothetical protein